MKSRLKLLIKKFQQKMIFVSSMDEEQQDILPYRERLEGNSDLSEL
jgi:hypothetical protein